MSVETTSMAWAFGLKNLVLPGRDEHRTFDPFLCIAGRPFDMARNDGTAHFLRLGAEYILHYDSDVVPPADGLLRLLAHKLPIVSGMYSRRSPPHSLPVMMKDGMWHTNFRMGSLVEVDFVGAGFFLVHRSVYEALPWSDERRGKKFFDWRVDCQGQVPPGEALSEDFSMNLAARKLGYKIYVDTSIRCKHVGLCEADYGTFLPCETRTRT